jgi:polysaccharide biosynthesis transport protein
MSTTVPTLPPLEEAPTPSLGVHDIIFTLFKHKWTILICTALGLVAAVAAFLLQPPLYQSQAKLLVRYLVERSAIDAVDSNSDVGGGRGGQAAIAAEVEILTSRDLAEQVAEAIGAKRLLPDAKGTPSNLAAAAVIAKSLGVDSSKESNILVVHYYSREPQLAQLVLQEIISHYFVKHLEVHRSAGAFEFVTQQTDQVRMRLNQTEAALKPLRELVGIISLADGRTALSADLARTEAQLHAAEVDLAEQRGRVKELGESPTAASVRPKAAATKRKVESLAPERQSPVAGEDNAKSSPAPSDMASGGQIQQYQVVVSSLAKLLQTKLDLLSKYKPGSVQVQLTQTQIDNLESQKADLEKKFPDLAATVPKTGTGTGAQQLDFASEKAQLAGIAAKVDMLKARLQDVQAKVKQLTELGPQIAELERTKELEEANYKYFQATLQKSRIDEALDPAKIPNISTVQTPSPPERVIGRRKKMTLFLAGAGLALGLVIALVSDLVLNRTVKRPLELEEQLHVPLLLSIPYTPDERLRLPAGASGKELAPYRNGGGSNGWAIAPWSAEHFIRPYCEAIRDRLGLYFELNHLTHKPKLVGVTSFSHEAGTSTLAAGLASALSETDEGKVLLVDVNLGPGEVHPFFKGKPAYPLATALQQSGPMDAAADNLYLATLGSAKSGPAQLGLKRFFDLMPNLKASDFDYIIFDMPPLGQTSPTWALSPFMDKMLLIVQSDTTNKEVVNRGYNKLVGERENVSVVFNKAQSYGPKWISGED